MNEHFLEDLTVGQRFSSGCLRIDADAVKRFAAEFDPQPFHLDEQAALGTIFKGLAASGWHTAALTMRLLTESEFKPAGGVIGASIEELRWPRPVRAGDELRLEIEILAVRLSQSRPQQGIVRVNVTTLNQTDDVLQTYIGNLVVLCRQTLASSGDETNANVKQAVEINYSVEEQAAIFAKVIDNLEKQGVDSAVLSLLRDSYQDE